MRAYLMREGNMSNCTWVKKKMSQWRALIHKSSSSRCSIFHIPSSSRPLICSTLPTSTNLINLLLLRGHEVERRSSLEPSDLTLIERVGKRNHLELGQYPA